MAKFELVSDFKPTGDQPQAIEKLAGGVLGGLKQQTLLGVTGSGKTFSIANVIEKVQKPTLVISHNKTLAAQLYQEFKEFFPNNAVEYFVSYYDYYQPEAYIPQTDTYIEKETEINEEIDKLRLSATTSLLTRKDVIVVASVSCIYNLGSPVEYGKTIMEFKAGQKISREGIFSKLVSLHYERNDYEFARGIFRAKGDTITIYPSYSDFAVRISLFGDVIESVEKVDPVSGKTIERLNLLTLYPAKHYITSPERFNSALGQIKTDLDKRVSELLRNGKMLEARRLRQKTNYDLELILEVGYCNGIENYSRYFDGRKPGETPNSLLEFFPKDYLLIVDESHMTIPQVRGMYNGDRSRKQTLIDFGFRLPSALDNRPLTFDEFRRKINQIIYTSATPDEYEISLSDQVVEQLIRPTGVLDPKVYVRKTLGQVEDLISEIKETVKKGQRVLITTLTKRMAEDLTDFLLERGIKVHYLHSDIETLERTDILSDLRLGKYDVIVGINLLREGLDLPEVTRVAILDADKEGFLRSETSLIQSMGRAARHIDSKVIMYADKITGSMKEAIDEVDRRRKYQIAYNRGHNITAISIKKAVRERLVEKKEGSDDLQGRIAPEILELEKRDFSQLLPEDRKKTLKILEREMKQAAELLDFEEAAKLRDIIVGIRGQEGKTAWKR